MTQNSSAIIPAHCAVLYHSSLTPSSTTSIPLQVSDSLGYGLGKGLRSFVDQIGAYLGKKAPPTKEELSRRRQLEYHEGGFSEVLTKFPDAVQYLQMNPKDQTALKRIQDLISSCAPYLKPTDDYEILEFQKRALKALREKISPLHPSLLKCDGFQSKQRSLEPDEVSQSKGKRFLQQPGRGASIFDLRGLNGTNGFALVSTNAMGSISSAGDIDDDGISDLFFGVPHDLPLFVFPYTSRGSARILFGSSSPQSATVDLDTLNGANGFDIIGYQTEQYLGWDVSSVRDISGDGKSEIVLSASRFPSSASDTFPGSVYVSFGNETWPQPFNISTLTGTNGFAVHGISNGDCLGYSVSDAGDVNHDGIGDLILGAPGSSPNGRYRAGTAYLLFGKAGGWPAVFDLDTLDGTNGFKIIGLRANDRLGTGVDSAGDVNGDTIDDLILGAPQARALPLFTGSSGAAYVIFGKPVWSAEFDLTLLNGANGFTAISSNYFSVGEVVSKGGDIDGDGIDDLLLGAPHNSEGDLYEAGSIHVIFGTRSGWPAIFDLALLNGANGFTIVGLDSYDYFGRSLASPGDIDGDGLNDILIGAESSPQALMSSGYGMGAAYIVFGRRGGWSGRFNLNTLDGTNGFAIIGLGNHSYLGVDVSTAGDFNNDGRTDFALLASREAYVIFGASSYPVTSTYIAAPPPPFSPPGFSPPGLDINITLTPEAIIGLGAGGGGLIFFGGLLTLILALRANKKGCFAPKAHDPGHSHMEVQSTLSLRRLDAYV